MLKMQEKQVWIVISFVTLQMGLAVTKSQVAFLSLSLNVHIDSPMTFLV